MHTGLGSRIKQIRLSHGLTMEEFGKKFNTSKGTVNNWEKERNSPNRENLMAIAHLGDMSVDELLNGSEESIWQRITSLIDDYSKKNNVYINFKALNLTFTTHMNVNRQISNEITFTTDYNNKVQSIDDEAILRDYLKNKKEIELTEAFLSVLDKHSISLENGETENEFVNEVKHYAESLSKKSYSNQKDDIMDDLTGWRKFNK